MKKNKKWAQVAAVLLLAVAVGGAGFWIWRSQAGKNSDATLGQPTNPQAAETDDMLALQSIELTQGKDGVEEWRLKAEWARMRKENDDIILTNPVITYLMPQEEDDLHVSSDLGKVNQAANQVELSSNIVGRNGESFLYSDFSLYDGQEKTMTFPEGARFSSPTAEGSADQMVWHLDTKVIEGQGNVKVTVMLETSPRQNATDTNGTPQ